MKLNKSYILPIIFTIICIGILIYLTPVVANRPWSEIISSTSNSLKNKSTDNVGLSSSSKSINGHSFEMIFQPARKRLLILNSGKEPTNSEIIEAEKIICYELRISSANQPDVLKEPNPRTFEDRVKYFSSAIQNNIQMIIGTDTLSCAMVQMERNFGVAPYLSIQTAFTAVKNWKTLPHHMILNDEYFGLGEIHLEKKLNETDL